MTTQIFQGLARYNRWANTVIFDLAGSLPEADYMKIRPAAFFGSIHLTLNHILLVDYLWFGRLRGMPFQVQGLDQELYENFERLQEARRAEDERIVSLVGALADTDLARTIGYRDTSGKDDRISTADLLVTVFNHQTHHRGQVHALLKEAGLVLPSIDYLDYLDAA